MSTLRRPPDPNRTHAFVLTLEGEEGAVLWALRQLLKRLLRAYGVKCRSIVPAPRERQP